MSAVETAFDGEIAHSFADYEGTIRGEVRYQLTRQNLSRFIGTRTLHVLDVGGGSGPDSVWFAEQGCSVTLLEPATDQLELARQRIERTGMQNRLETVQGTIEDLVDRPGEYDVVLSHCVAMYLDNPHAYFGRLAHIVKSEGYVSILEKGYAAAYAYAVSQGDFAGAYKLAETGRCTNRLGRETSAFRPEDLESSLEASGLWVRQWSGVRVLHDTDRRKTVDVSETELATILSRETEAGHDDATRGMGQLLHFIFQK